jgi:hypothetical protein
VLSCQHGTQGRKFGNGVGDDMNSHGKLISIFFAVMQIAIRASADMQRSNRHRVRKRSSSVQILCARSSVISNFISASSVFT